LLECVFTLCWCIPNLTNDGKVLLDQKLNFWKRLIGPKNSYEAKKLKIMI
jgi:hypothetical protein